MKSLPIRALIAATGTIRIRMAGVPVMRRHVPGNSVTNAGGTEQDAAALTCGLGGPE
ncbi:hypothetical protein OG539_43590 [Actinacidiphila glaucinigra]|uniref:hypothetical protein n=1 Tax=Actinacidiphila glaucinigra TaxID=235986 RepID=UPI00324AD7FB